MSSRAGLQIFQAWTASAQIEVSCGTDRIGFGSKFGAFVGGRPLKRRMALATLSLERALSSRFAQSRV